MLNPQIMQMSLNKITATKEEEIVFVNERMPKEVLFEDEEQIIKWIANIFNEKRIKKDFAVRK